MQILPSIVHREGKHEQAHRPHTQGFKTVSVQDVQPIFYAKTKLSQPRAASPRDQTQMPSVLQELLRRILARQAHEASSRRPVHGLIHMHHMRADIQHSDVLEAT